MLVSAPVVYKTMSSILYEFAGLSKDYNTALCSVASILAIKIGALNLLTVRSRLITGDFATGKEGGVSQPADEVIAPVVQTIFKFSLGAFGPTYSTQVRPARAVLVGLAVTG